MESRPLPFTGVVRDIVTIGQMVSTLWAQMQLNMDIPRTPTITGRFVRTLTRVAPMAIVHASTVFNNEDLAPRILRPAGV
jgi:hypothetical protein